MSEELKAAQARIACLEGEIAKRDEELAACRVAVENCDLFRARIAEMQERFDSSAHRTSLIGRLEIENAQLSAELAALKAQGVVMPERWNVPRPMWKDVRQPYGNPLNHADIEAAEKFNLALDEVVRLNAAPAAPAADAWIPVSERLPAVESRLDQECRVGTLSIAPLNISAAVLVFDGEKVKSTRLEWFDGCLPLPYCITHWMPLPAAPSANSAKGVV